MTSLGILALSWRVWCPWSCGDVFGALGRVVTHLVPLVLLWRLWGSWSCCDVFGAPGLVVTSLGLMVVLWRLLCPWSCCDVFGAHGRVVTSLIPWSYCDVFGVPDRVVTSLGFLALLWRLWGSWSCCDVFGVPGPFVTFLGLLVLFECPLARPTLWHIWYLLISLGSRPSHDRPGARSEVRESCVEMLPTLKGGFPETGLLALRLTIAHFWDFFSEFPFRGERGGGGGGGERDFPIMTLIPSSASWLFSLLCHVRGLYVHWR